jgi:hypothetical protein
MALAWMVSPALALPTISYGTAGSITLFPNTAGQQVQFNIADGSTQIDGLEFNIQVGDGGAALGGTDVGPLITDIDLITGTIFASASPTQVDVVTFDLARQSTVDTTSTVGDSGLLATVTFSTVGLSIGQFFDILLTGVAGSFDTTVFDGASTLTTVAPNGLIVIVPVPGDFNLDGQVDGLDLNILGDNWQDSPTTFATGDANGDGTTNGLDLNILGENWQFGVPAPGAAIPEPASLALLGIGAIAMLRRRR